MSGPTHQLPQHHGGQRSDVVPGRMTCARCKFSLIRTTLNVTTGVAGAGDSNTEPCPNGCGPLWPVTWEQAAREAWADNDALFERAKAAEDALSAVRSQGLQLAHSGAPARVRPLLVRDLAQLLGSSVPAVCQALEDLGRGTASTNAAVDAEDALAVQAHLAAAGAL